MCVEWGFRVYVQVERLQAISQLLWRAEVDIENIEDMLSRLQQPNGFGHIAVSDALSSFNELLAGQVRSWGGQVSTRKCMQHANMQKSAQTHAVLTQAGSDASVWFCICPLAWRCPSPTCCRCFQLFSRSSNISSSSP